MYKKNITKNCQYVEQEEGRWWRTSILSFVDCFTEIYLSYCYKISNEQCKYMYNILKFLIELSLKFVKLNQILLVSIHANLIKIGQNSANKKIQNLR
jgi:hypothetical protein